MKIEFNKPLYDKNEINYVEDALVNDTDYCTLVKTHLQTTLGQDKVYLTCNGSSALDLLFGTLSLPTGSEVIMPSLTFPSAANSALRLGLKPVFADISLDSLVVDTRQFSSAITPKTSCLVPIHYGSASADLNSLLVLANQHNLFVIEDAALAYGGTYNGKALGTIGHAGIYSFHKTKNLSCDEGGIALLNDTASDLHNQLSLLYNNGTDKEAFLQNTVKWYTWKQAGMNVSMSNVTAAILYAQLKKSAVINKIRKQIYTYYYNAFTPLSERFGFKLPVIPKYNTNNYHVFYLVFPSNEIREKVRLHLHSKKIAAHIHYRPLHLSTMGKQLGYQLGDFPNAERIAETMLRLPLHNCMQPSDAEIVVSAIAGVL
jgi:dTDP-4-amino-4,6-dideoxygalactose transaminase